MRAQSPWALTPMLLFMALFIGSGLYYQAQGVEYAFYKISAPVAILPAIILSLFLAKGTINKRVENFISGCANHTIVTMLLIFLLAGGFASVAKSIGGVDAVVDLGLSLIPAPLVLPGLFVMTAFMATAMGTSMGSIAAVAPIAVGLAEASELPLVLTVGTVMGGAMFGDNLSIISDTTIAATRTQGCNMRDKFRLNFKIAIPAALLTIIWLFIQGDAANVNTDIEHSPIKVLPYLLVLVLAVLGLNVIVVLLTGIVLAGFIGLWQLDAYTVSQWSADIYKGYSNMQEILILSLLIGGLGAMMKSQGGLTWLAAQFDRLSRQSGSPKSHRRIGEGIIAVAVALVNMCTANNTVAILISGSLAKDIAERYGVDPKRSASIMDMSSCIVQGIIPYGAQMLLAASLAGLSPLSLITAVTYCWFLLLAMVVSIALGWPKGFRDSFASSSAS
ncbi:Na+/H+ antiporter NhaC family protein [Bermanella marisrubri]|uniref:Na+/H+ antiporter n=1 Tax=Bermanella marisrubri TaxID=207949 RepID=Q1N0D3_9GAMM|nr:Na+/H+ antiporter NhaC family protein [Bermanella marisrubri]EAT11731.1 Na+/H+ antiporter [Oceanobacter sp. RED65] [Bermanella marisrubri]QIZ83237.1 Na+/H+ antiporter NhaC family protein [Bermanella marisrubri]